ncbi:MAG: PQQ-binding-like beta-propeller repeat protein, partial [Planctomycetota bacterium]|nr:PQQ-binding-like beta-propeller repeat protein [Planctomycetota bacterium]
IAKHSPKVYAKQEERAGALGREAIENKSNDSMIAVIARYPVSKMAAELRYQLAQYYNDRFLHSLSTEALEAFLLDYPKNPKAAQAMALLAETLKKRNRDHDAKRVALELLNGFQGDSVRNGQGQKMEVRTFVRALLNDVQKIRNPMALAMRDRCADLRKPLNRSFRLEMDLNGLGTKSLEVGPHEDLQHFFLKRANSLEARLVDGGLLSWSIPCQMDFEERKTPVATRGTLAVPFESEVQGVDIVSGGLLWTYQPKALGKRQIFVGKDTVACLRVDKENVYVLSNGGELACLDAVTGKIRWKSVFNGRLAGLLETRSDRVLVATNLPAGVTVLDRKTGKITKRVPLSNDLRSEHRGPMVTTKRGIIAVVGRHHLVGYNFDTDKMLFERRIATLGSIKTVYTSKDERFFYVVGSQQRGDVSSMVAMSAVTGIQIWGDDGRGRMKGFGRKYGNSTKIKQIYCGDRALYTVRREGLEKTQIWAQDLETGAQKWVWRCPPGQGPQMVIETPGQLIVPYGGQLGRCSLTIIAKGSGQTIDTYRIPGRKVVSTAVAAGTLLVMTDRGQFAFARVKEDQIARDVVEMLEIFGSKKKVEPLLAALIADRLQKSGTINPAVELLAKSLLSESLTQKDFRLLYSKLVTLLEMQIEKSQPKMNIQRMSRPAEIDGDLNDWYRQWSAVSTAGPVHVLPIQGMPGGEGEFWRGQEDLSAKLYMAYDDKNFYFALDVRDQDLRPYDSEAKRWIGDCLLIAIDCKNNGGQWYSRDDILLSLALTRPRKKKKKDQDPQDPKKAEKEKNRPSGKYFVKRKEDHSGVIYECKIPWSMFEKYGVTVPKAGPPKGFTFGFNFVLTDDDGGRRGDGKSAGALKALSWTPSLRLHADKSRVWQGYIPEYFGKVTLD